MATEASIDLTPAQRKEVLSLLETYLPNTEVWAYGSRAKWTSRPNSDLDLVAFVYPEQKARVSLLKEAFVESNLPFRVDFFVWDEVPVQFRGNIQRDHVVLVERVEKCGGADLYPHEPLGDLVSIHDSERIPVKKSERKGGPYPYYGASGIVDYVHDYLFDGDYVLLAEDGDNLRSRNTPIAFMARGQFWVNNHAHIIKGKLGNSTNFICYALQIADVASYISGSTRPKITQKDMRRIPVYCPPIEEQKAIAHILGSLDDKIELNRQMNATLESMAQALFKSWFVDFDPVIDNAQATGNPIPEPLHAKAEIRKALGDKRKPLPEAIQEMFPSSFVHSGEMGWVPEGWDIRCLGKATELIIDHRGKTPKKMGGDWSLSGYPAISAKNIKDGNIVRPDSIRYVGENLYKRWMKEPLKQGDIALTSEAPLGELYFFASRSNYLLSQRLYGLRANADICSGSYLYLWLQTNIARTDLLNRATGTTVTGIRQSELRKVNVLCPTKNIVSALSESSVELLLKIDGNSVQIEELSKLRDILLPKLLSGQLRIPDAENLVAEVL